MDKRKIHLIANAHIDPVWQWEIDEGIGTAVSTFSSACELSKRYDYVFCHNESMLYEWIEKNLPELYEMIRKNIDEGKWSIMGGWFLQPDCNMPSGEAMVRQIRTGKKYFCEHFGKEPEIAVNVDSFGHSAGLVQILVKNGYKGYMFGRPLNTEVKFPAHEFLWRGLGGYEIPAVRIQNCYNSRLGHVDDKIRQIIDQNPDEDLLLVLWGVGNHGGGPSAADLEKIRSMQKRGECELIHSTPENYFQDLLQKKKLSSYEGALQPCMPGCYTSQSRLKRTYRELENLFFFTEKLCSIAVHNGCIAFPAQELEQAQHDLFIGQFHDILPGSAVQNAEQDSIRIMDHGITILRKLRMDTVYSMMKTLQPTKAGEYTILVANPHPYAIKTTIECEYMLADQDHSGLFHRLEITDDSGTVLCSQIVKENSNIPIDWRKKIAFDVVLKPSCINQFTGRDIVTDRKPCVSGEIETFVFENDFYTVKIDREGCICEIRSGGKTVLSGQICPVVFADSTDSWGMRPDQLWKMGKQIGYFEQMSRAGSSSFSGANTELGPLRIVEDGDVLVRIENVMRYGESKLLMQYTFYRHHEFFDMEILLFSEERDRLMKLAVPAEGDKFVAEDMFGCFEFSANGQERVHQRFVANYDSQAGLGICNDGSYASSAENGYLYLNLARSAGYTCHPLGDKRYVPNDRYVARMDQGEIRQKFRFYPWHGKSQVGQMFVRAQLWNEAPYALSASVPKVIKIEKSIGPLVSNRNILMTAYRISENDSAIVRLQNGCNDHCETSLTVNDQTVSVSFLPFEVKTIRFYKNNFEFCEEMEI